MMMRTLYAVAGLVVGLMFGAPALAAPVTCTSLGDAGALAGPPGSFSFANNFGSAGAKTDCYTFTLAGTANASGALAAFDLIPGNKLDIDVTAVSLFSGGVIANQTTGALLDSDLTPSSFGFANLAAGIYTMVVESSVTDDPAGSFNATVGYNGDFTTVAVTVDPPIEIPEPPTALLAILPLLGLALRLRRRGAGGLLPACRSTAPA